MLTGLRRKFVYINMTYSDQCIILLATQTP